MVKLEHQPQTKPARAQDAAPAAAGQQRAILIRIEDLPPTPVNLERIRGRVRRLNRHLAVSNTPFRLRVVEDHPGGSDDPGGAAA